MDKWLNHFDIEVDSYNKDEGGMISADKERTQNKMKLFERRWVIYFVHRMISSREICWTLKLPDCGHRR